MKISDIPSSPYTFNIVSVNPPYLILYSPTAHDIVNDTVSINWNASDYEDGYNLPISLFYSDNDDENWYFLDEVNNKVEFDWNTSRVPDGLYKVKIETIDSDKNKVSETSEMFYIGNHLIDFSPSSPGISLPRSLPIATVT